jgi:thiamine-monophosphate kinase
MNELELIQLLTKNLPTNNSVVTGTGDDCAVLDLGIPDRFLLFKTDAIVEGTHFTRDAAPERIGRKALARNLSATRHGVAIVGGETTTNPERILISIALIGTVAKDRCIRRRGSRPGDAIFVSGTLGGSIDGWHFDFEPRLAEARWLADNFTPTSMIDVSDGLASDIRHLLEHDLLGAELLKSAIPISRAAKLKAKEESSAKPPLLAALTDGEDFELLFTVPSKLAVKLLDGWKQTFPQVPLACIGKVTDKPGVKLRDKDGYKPMPTHGYVHFA